MFENEYVLSVDIKKSMTTTIPVFVQYDSASLVFKIFDNGKPFDLTEFTSAEVSHKRADGTLVIGYGSLETLTNGTQAIRYTYQGNEMSQPGFVSASLSVYSADKKVSILPFKVEIVGDTYEESIESSPEVGVLQQLIASVSGVSGQATQAVASATQAVTQANVAVNNAQSIADNTRSVGTFSLSTAYLKNNIVVSNGSSWIALVNTQNNPLPTLPTTQNTWWRLLAQKGENGEGTGSGTVTKINSIDPDGTGNVTLTPAIIGAAPTTHSHEISQVAGLDAALTTLEDLRTKVDGIDNNIIVNESTRQTNETTRQTNETTRNNAEALRTANMGNRIHRGEFSVNTSYLQHNEVFYNGSTWRCLTASTGQVPSEDSIYWTLIARKGVDGIGGTVASVNGITPNDSGNVQLTTLEIRNLDGESETITDTVEIPITHTLLNGFHASSNGGFSQNNGAAINGWRTADPISHTGTKTYKLVYNYNSDTPTARILRWNGNTYLGSIPYAVNTPFTIESPTTRFSFNMGLPGAVPNTTPALSPFSVIEAIENVSLVSIEQVTREVVVGETLKNTLDSIKTDISELTELIGGTPQQPTLKVLMIGNSFSDDVQQHIHLIARSVGVNVIFAQAYRPGETLQGHWNQINSNASTFGYRRRSHINGAITNTTTENVSFRTILTAEDWDVVTYQQGSPLSGMYETFQPYLQNIINYVNTNRTNPNVRHGLHKTWAYPTTSNESGFANYNRNQLTMYNAIVDAYQRALESTDIDLLIPTGTAIQNARSVPYLQRLNSDMASDGFHLGDMGDYIGGLVLFEVLIAHKYKKSLIDDVAYTVGSKYLSYLGKIAVKNAVLNRFTITDI